MEKENEVKKYPYPGKYYQHYKGGIYEVLFMTKHSETDEDLVIYKSVHFGSYHARPLHMWFEEIKGHGQRFQQTVKF
ncbi:MAG TPA: DUF1653 domain-containing protein [Nitrosopumilaceae archaeon]|jgi:hypothetical protein|nr:DUF1653 domain-containing protein [Nitrosopumilaceae archaeon]